jgi:hypothetical protein
MALASVTTPAPAAPFGALALSWSKNAPQVVGQLAAVGARVEQQGALMHLTFARGASRRLGAVSRGLRTVWGRSAGSGRSSVSYSVDTTGLCAELSRSPPEDMGLMEALVPHTEQVRPLRRADDDDQLSAGNGRAQGGS